MMLLLLVLLLLWLTIDKRGDALMNLVAYTRRELVFFYRPATGDEARSVNDPLPHVGCEGSEAGSVGVVKLAHLRVCGFDTVVRHAWKLGTSRVGIDDEYSAVEAPL